MLIDMRGKNKNGQQSVVNFAVYAFIYWKLYG